jgi:xylulokinase
MSLTVGLDVGTQGTKALVWDRETGCVVARASVSYGLLDGLAPGAAEQHPDTWTEAVMNVLARVLEGLDAAAVGALSVSGQQHGCVLLDETDRPLRPAKLWCDTETAEEARELAMPAGYTAPKVLWSQRHEPDLFERVAAILLPHDYVNLFLTGERAAEWGDASGTGYFDPVARRWRADFFDQGLLPPLLGPGESVGTLRGELAATLGLGALPVATGSGDNMMSAIGAGATESGILVVSLGTSGTLFTHTDEPLLDPQGAVAPFCDATGGGLPLVCTMNCTTATEEVRLAFGRDLEEITELAAREPVGADGLRFLPYLAGERTPDWPLASGVLHGLRAGSLSPGPLFRAALEGVSFCLWRGLASLADLGIETREVRLVGGGSANPLWRQILADLFGMTLRVPMEPQTAALGAALQAAALLEGVPVGRIVSAGAIPLEQAAVDPTPSATRTLREAAIDHARLSDQLFA